METLVFGAVRPSPESCDDRGKQSKQETESESESEDESQKEPEEESEYEEESDWESKTLEEMKQKYDNDPRPRYFACKNFEYENDARKKYIEESDKAMFDYCDMIEGISPFDPIPIPPLANIPGNNFPRELFITEECLEDFTHLSKLALADYNNKNQLANDKEYEFAELVKAVSQRIPLGTYYITFNAKPKDATSNCSATTFQAHVEDNMRGTVLKSCSTKT